MNLTCWELVQDMIQAGAVQTYPGDFEIRNSKGNLHREDGPASVDMSINSYCSVAWCIDGFFHRSDGPAIIEYDSDWRIYHIEFWRGGRFVNDKRLY